MHGLRSRPVMTFLRSRPGAVAGGSCRSPSWDRILNMRSHAHSNSTPVIAAAPAVARFIRRRWPMSTMSLIDLTTIAAAVGFAVGVVLTLFVMEWLARVGQSDDDDRLLVDGGSLAAARHEQRIRRVK